MSQGQPAARIKSGPPWWLWILLVVATLAVVISIGVTAIPDDPQQLYADAIKSIESRDSDAFEENLAKLRKFPEFAAHVSYLDGRAAARATRDVKALELFQVALDNDQIKPLALEEIAKCQTRMGEFTVAIDTYQQAIVAAEGDSQSAKLSLAGLYYSVGALGLAESTLNEILEADPENSGATGLRGTVRMGFGRYAEAVEDYHSLLSTPGGRAAADPQVVSGCCQCLLKVGTPEQWETFLSENGDLLSDDYLKIRLKIAAGQTEGLSSMIESSELLSSNMVKKGLATAALALAEDDPEIAKKEIETLFTMVTRDPETFELGRQAYDQLGDAAAVTVCDQNLAKLTNLRQQFREVISKECKNVTEFEARLKAGHLQKQMGNFDDARKWFTMAVLLSPDDAETAGEAMESVFERLPMLVEFPKPAVVEEDQKPVAADGDQTADEPVAGDQGAQDKGSPEVKDDSADANSSPKPADTPKDAPADDKAVSDKGD